MTPSVNQNISKQMDPKELTKKSCVAVAPNLKDATVNFDVLSKLTKPHKMTKNCGNVIPEERHMMVQGDDTASKSAGALGNFQSSAEAGEISSSL